jgi:hypothetical protein
MPDTSSLQSLYSALIQAGATIVAVLGGFLLTFGPGRQEATLDRIRSIEDSTRQMEQHQRRLQDFIDSYPNPYSHPALGRVLRSENPPESVLSEMQTTQQQGRELVVTTDRLVEHARHERDRLRAHLKTMPQFYDAGLALTALTLFCLIFPLIALAWLPSDTDPFRRSFFAVVGYSTALLYVPLLAFKTVTASTSRLFGDDEVTTNHPTFLSWIERGMLLALIVSAIGFIAISFLTPPTGSPPNPRATPAAIASQSR